MTKMAILKKKVIELQGEIMEANTETYKRHLISKLEGVLDLAVTLGIIYDKDAHFAMHYRIDNHKRFN